MCINISVVMVCLPSQLSPIYIGIQSALWQMVYLLIKELANTTEDIIMVMSSIQKDTQLNLKVMYQPNAIHALCCIIDASPLPSSYSILSPQWSRPWNDSTRL